MFVCRVGAKGRGGTQEGRLETRLSACRARETIGVATPWLWGRVVAVVVAAPVVGRKGSCVCFMWVFWRGVEPRAGCRLVAGIMRRATDDGECKKRKVHGLR